MTKDPWCRGCGHRQRYSCGAEDCPQPPPGYANRKALELKFDELAWFEQSVSELALGARGAALGMPPPELPKPEVFEFRPMHYGRGPSRSYAGLFTHELERLLGVSPCFADEPYEPSYRALGLWVLRAPPTPLRQLQGFRIGEDLSTYAPVTGEWGSWRLILQSLRNNIALEQNPRLCARYSDRWEDDGGAWLAAT